MAHYDYMILGAGASGLMLARAMAEDPWFKSKKILIIDREAKDQNDRTWCFWEKGPGQYDHLLSKKWDQILFKSSDFVKKPSILPYQYKMLRSADFYRDQWKFISDADHIQFLQARVEQITELEDAVQVKTDQKSLTAQRVFNSFFNYADLLNQKQYPVLQQHFVGWFVESDQAVFDQMTPTFMDFSVAQKGNTRFMYVLPFTGQKALVEYTLFSQEPLQTGEYEKEIEAYLREHYQLNKYSILEKEKGNIPMSCYDFEQKNSERILHIGTAGGWAKASTGYAFKNSMKHTPKVVEFVKKGHSFQGFSVKNRYRFYDSLLLDILYEDNSQGARIFSAMFRNRKVQQILKFLDEDGNLFQDMWLISGCPVLPFSKALLKRFF